MEVEDLKFLETCKCCGCVYDGSYLRSNNCPNCGEGLGL